MAFEIRNMTIGYKGAQPLVRDMNLVAPEGELVAVMGRNGVGKSTMLRSLAGMVRPVSGDVLLGGVSLFGMTAGELARSIAFVSTEIVSVAHLRVWDVAAMGRSPYTGWTGYPDSHDKACVVKALEQVGMMDFAHIALDRLSDGERQRVMIARALAQDTGLILLDEPTAFLDLPNRYQIAVLLRDLAHRTGKIIVFSTHDLATASELCDAMWVMSPEGVSTGAPEDLIGNGGFEPIFRDTCLSLDCLTGEIHLGIPPLKYVRVEQGSAVLYRALKRCGIAVDGQAEHMVNALPDGGYSADGKFYDSIYALSRYLKTLQSFFSASQAECRPASQISSGIKEA